MIVELTPETYFENVNTENVLNIVMCYGQTCGPCKKTMPSYEAVAKHFEDFNIPNVKFFKFHHWEKEYIPFIKEHNLSVKGVPTFKYYYFGDVMEQESKAYTNPNQLKKHIIDVMRGIEITTPGVFGYGTS